MAHRAAQSRLRKMPELLAKWFSFGTCALVALLAVSCAADAYPGEPAPGTIPGFGAPQGTASTPASSNGCPTYEDDFLPKIHTPICSNCHGRDPQLRNWGVYATAASACGRIGSVVAGGSMPPRSSGLSLNATQAALVAEWVSLGCPQSASTVPSSCTSSPSSGSPQPAPSAMPSTTPVEPGEDEPSR